CNVVVLRLQRKIVPEQSKSYNFEAPGRHYQSSSKSYLIRKEAHSMLQRRIHRHSIFCILPPYILHSIAQNGTSQQRTQALQTLGSDQTFRTMRVTHDLMTAVGRRLPAAAPATEGQPQRTIYNSHTTTNLPGDT